jgi:divalent metal cation (Fe/Co/Zn/Cd) transporter
VPILFICVDPNLNVMESHEITEKIEEILLERHQMTKALIHIEPYHMEKVYVVSQKESS